MAPMPRWALAAGAVALLGALIAAAVLASRWEAGESVAIEPMPAASTSASAVRPSPTPTPEIIVWAEGVCAARDDLIGSVVEVAQSLEYDPSDPASIGEQFQRQIPGQLDGVDAATSELTRALGDIPVDYLAAAAAIPLLQDRLADLDAAREEAAQAVGAARAAGDPVSAGIAWLQVATSAKTTYDAGMLVKDSLGELAASSDGDVRDAFASAPGCSSISAG